MADTIVYAVVPMPKYFGKAIDRGEIFRLANGKNDEKLIGLQYVRPYNPKDHHEIDCGKCSRKFIDLKYLSAHQRKADCNSDPGEMTKHEMAEIVGIDPEKIRLDTDEAEQKVFSEDQKYPGR